ncbi:uncharacterized protein ARMOST_20777 [Armillaria ostoyae]|uniref:Uncharacterized protein n=1 Tax=Armillaria ostoyae TaxID=47428 RepID=A0A284S889_ARMOS|nr:uncharacterized protein ARMOST_20777 [Armillaria ostoyae]
MIKKQVINRGILAYFLAKLPGQSPELVESLIDPIDHQNVPRVMKLLMAITQLKDLNTMGMDPITLDQLLCITIYGDLIDAYIQPFINPEYSLTDQLVSLSKAGHMLMALFHSHGTSFTLNQLYSNLQNVVKSSYVSIGKQQDLDSFQPFHIYQQASDQLELTFCEVWTDDHDPNPDTLQLGEDLGAGINQIVVYKHHPTWNRGQRRLSYTGSEGADHVNPQYFKGNLISGSVKLKVAWSLGKMNAIKSLESAGVHFDFDRVLASEGIDFLCPFGGNYYPGMSLDPDRSLVSDAESESGVADDHEDCLDMEENNISDSEATDVKEEDEDEELRLDDFLADKPDADGSVKTSHDVTTDWLTCVGDNRRSKPVHKASILSSLFTSAKLSKD